VSHGDFVQRASVSHEQRFGHPVIDTDVVCPMFQVINDVNGLIVQRHDKPIRRVQLFDFNVVKQVIAFEQTGAERYLVTHEKHR
jgi:hypothetical protein